jgi:hypothetical protein
MLVFSVQLCELLPSNLLSGSIIPPFPLWICKYRYTVYTYTVCKGGWIMGVLGLRQMNTYRKVLLQIIFLDDDILHCLLWVLSFYFPLILDYCTLYSWGTDGASGGNTKYIKYYYVWRDTLGIITTILSNNSLVKKMHPTPYKSQRLSKMLSERWPTYHYLTFCMLQLMDAGGWYGSAPVYVVPGVQFTLCTQQSKMFSSRQPLARQRNLVHLRTTECSPAGSPWPDKEISPLDQRMISSG